MTRDDIAEKVHAGCGDLTSKEAARRVTKKVFEVLAEALEAGTDVSVHGFGRFLIKDRKARQCRNPQTGDMMTVPAKKVLQFKPTPGLQDRVNA